MTVDWTKPLQTRNGRYKARVICTDKAGDQPIVVLVKSGNGEWLQTTTIDGIVHEGPGDISDYDIINVPRVSRCLSKFFRH